MMTPPDLQVLQEVANGTFAAADHSNDGLIPLPALKTSIDEYCRSAEDLAQVKTHSRPVDPSFSVSFVIDDEKKKELCSLLAPGQIINPDP